MTANLHHAFHSFSFRTCQHPVVVHEGFCHSWLIECYSVQLQIAERAEGGDTRIRQVPAYVQI